MERAVDVPIAGERSRRAEPSYVIRLIALFCAGWAVIYADRTVLYPLLTVIEREFHLSGLQTGWISGAYFALYVAAMLPAGLLAPALPQAAIHSTGRRTHSPWSSPPP